VLVHCPGRLGAAAAVTLVKLPCRDGMFTQWALERTKAVHAFDRVISHNFKCSPLSLHDSELKLPLQSKPALPEKALAELLWLVPLFPGLWKGL
jgi:hypothetical protein